MDPGKSASAPLKDWPDEKFSAGNPPPPPYQDHPNHPNHPNQGFSHPGPAYPPQVVQVQYPGVVYGQQNYSIGQPGIVTVQPTVFVRQGPLEHPVNDYLCYSIFTMLCCCLPLGVAALIFSISTREANHAGDRILAEQKSKTARTLNHVALGIGLGIIVLYIVYIAVVVSVVKN